MATLSIRLPGTTRDRLAIMANHRGLSLDKLTGEFSARALPEHDTELCLRPRAARGDPERRLAILDTRDGSRGRDRARRVSGGPRPTSPMRVGPRSTPVPYLGHQLM